MSNPTVHIKFQPWSTGLCGCLSDIPNCCLTFWCPCITFGRIAEFVDEGKTSCCASGSVYAMLSCLTCGCPWCYSCSYRTKMRRQFLLNDSPCGDCLVHCCCEKCALCQEYLELKNHGFDMFIGWEANAARKSKPIALAPMVEGGMTR